MPSPDINPPARPPAPALTLANYERKVLIQALNHYIEGWTNRQRRIDHYVPTTPPAITVAHELLERLRR